MTRSRPPTREDIPLPRRISLIAQSVRWLRRSIVAGIWKDVLPGERELSRRLSVSRPTLRAALDQLRRDGWIEVSQGCRRRLSPAAARRSRRGGATSIGLLTPLPLQAVPPFVMFWIDGLRARLAEAGYHLDIHVDRACHGARPERALEAAVGRARAAAWVLFLSNARMQRWFSARGLPCLVAGSAAPAVPLPSLDIDYRAACRHAAGLLLARNHRRIALLLPAGDHPGDAESELGFRDVLQRPRAGAYPSVLRHDETAADLCRLLDAALKLPHPPTAFLVARSAAVLTALTHLLRRGCRIPRDVSLVGRDDDAFLQFAVPRVTRYANDPALFARRLSRELIRVAQGDAQPRAIKLLPRFLPGDTLGEAGAHPLDRSG